MNQENSRNGVQRNLFGTARSDHNKSQESLMREANKITREKSEIWNFDFENFEPLPPGRYKWERVGKRLQTRASPVPDTLESTSGSRARTIEKIAPGSKRHYNLRTRETARHEMEYFRPIEPEGCSKVPEALSDGASSTVLKDNTDLAPTKKKRKQQQIKRKIQLAEKLNTT